MDLQPAPPPVSSLSDDLLMEILKCLISTETDIIKTISYSTGEAVRYFQNLQPILATGVCRTWRSTALSARSLWARWNICISDPSTSFWIILKRFIERTLKLSERSLLSINFRLHRFDSTEFSEVGKACFEDALNLLFSEQGRWKEVQMCIGDGILERPLRFNANELSLLEKLRLDGGRHVLERTRIEGPTFPSLRRFDMLCVEEAIPIDDILLFDIVEDIWYDIIARRDSIGQILSNRGPLIIKPSVRSLQIMFLGLVTNIHALNDPISRLSCSSLTKLSLHGALISTVYCAADLMDRSACSLKSLEFVMGSKVGQPDNHRLGYQCGTLDEAFVALLRKTPSLEQFALAFHRLYWLPTFVKSLTFKIGDSPVLIPRLDNLTLNGVRAPQNSFMDLISSRRQTQKRAFQNVLLQDCSERPSKVCLPAFPSVSLRDAEESDNKWNAIGKFVEDGFSFHCTRSGTENYKVVDDDDDADKDS